MKKKLLILLMILSAGITVFAQQDQTYKGTIATTFDQSKEWWPVPATPPKDAPNVIWILIDDVGFGAR